MKRWIDDLISIFFPPVCHVCGNRIEGGPRFVCPQCMETLPRTFFHLDDFNPMVRRLAGKVRFERATGVYFYSRNSGISSFVQDFKYRNFPSLAVYAGRMMYSELYMSGFFSGIDFLVPVPLHPLKKLKRGYSQTELICKGISRESGIPVSNRLRARRHRTQTGLSHDERATNVSGVFRMRKGTDLVGKHILLVDDICTTGATISAAVSAISEEYPAAEISILTYGVTPE